MAALRLLTLTFAALLVCGSLAPAVPATSPTQAAPATGTAAPLGPDAAWHTAEQVRATAALLAEGGPLSASLAKATATDLATLAREPPSATLAEALGRLAAQAGLPAGGQQPAGFAALPADLQATLTVLVDGVRETDRLLDLAFAALSPQERADLTAGALLLGQPGATSLEERVHVARLSALAERVDAGALRAAGLALLQAAEQAPRPAVPSAPAAAPSGLGAPAPSGAPGSPSILAGTVTSCYSSAPSLVDLTGMVEVGFAGPNSYSTERVLILDPEGNDCYENHPGSYGPGSTNLLPVSLVVDYGGNDQYYARNVHPYGPAGTTWGSGVGIGGVGLVFDAWGDDFHYAELIDEPDNCRTYYFSNDHWQRLYAQGVGILGAGLLVDADGNDLYYAHNTNTVDSVGCHWGRVYTYAQGLGARFGLGILADQSGDDTHIVDSHAQGKADNLAHTHGQGAAAPRGVGLLVDFQGQDSYSLDATAQTGLPSTDKGNFAYTFGQGSLYGTNEPRLEGSTLLNALAVSTTKGGNVCSSSLTPTTAGTTVTPVPCDFQGVALLVDLLGADRYAANANAWDAGLGCTWAAWSVVSAQGSAPAKGAAGLVDLTVDESDVFSINANSDAAGCPTLGVRSAAYGQGFGGAILWDHWDRPPFEPVLVTDASIGVLVRGGACGPYFPKVALSGSPPFVTVGGAFALNRPCGQGWGSDLYRADANARNGGSGLAWAQTFAQGAGNGQTTYSLAYAPYTVTYDALGAGVHADVSGDDRFDANANANGGTTRQPQTTAQGAGLGAIGVLANVIGDDGYSADAYDNGSPIGALAQADASSQPIGFTVCVPPGGTLFCNTSTLNLAVGILVDLSGRDSYSEFAYTGCPYDGPIAAPHFWGNTVPTVPACPTTTTGLALGLDALT